MMVYLWPSWTWCPSLNQVKLTSGASSTSHSNLTALPTFVSMGTILLLNTGVPALEDETTRQTELEKEKMEGSEKRKEGPNPHRSAPFSFCWGSRGSWSTQVTGRHKCSQMRTVPEAGGRQPRLLAPMAAVHPYSPHVVYAHMLKPAQICGPGAPVCVCQCWRMARPRPS